MIPETTIVLGLYQLLATGDHGNSSEGAGMRGRSDMLPEQFSTSFRVTFTSPAYDNIPMYIGGSR